MAEGKVRDIGRDIEGEMNQLLEDVSIGLILDDKETETDLLSAETEPSTKERGEATQALPFQKSTNANGEGGKEQRHNSGHPCQGLPILTTKQISKVWAGGCLVPFGLLVMELAFTSVLVIHFYIAKNSKGMLLAPERH